MSAGGSKPNNLTEEVAKYELSDLFLTSLIELPNFGDAKSVLSYYSVVYELNREKLYSTINCESTFRHEGLFGDSGKAYGIAQFHKPTFDLFCDGEYTDQNDQLFCFAKMVKEGLGSHWTCYK
ncbi:MAG: transglycosylase-like protein [Siphoviridae sp. cttb18]|nr:MAG: transglycosylase-like protein [Siphoviridae sp. cttb18]